MKPSQVIVNFYVYSPCFYLLKALTTAHMTSMLDVPVSLAHSCSGSKLSRSLTRFIAISQSSSLSGEKAFSNTSDEWAKNKSDINRLSSLLTSLHHLSNTESWTRFISFCFKVESLSGWVVMSNKKKFFFSVLHTPFSTKDFARRSRTFLS